MSSDGPGNGEFHFNLTGRRDRYGNYFLFAGLRFLNAVLFIRPDPTDTAEHPRKWRAVLKPFIALPGATTVDEFAWPDDLTNETKPTDKGKAK